VLSCTAETGCAQNLCHEWLERDKITTTIMMMMMMMVIFIDEIALLEKDHQGLVGNRSVKL